jgi:hypothetical protein
MPNTADRAPLNVMSHKRREARSPHLAGIHASAFTPANITKSSQRRNDLRYQN